MLTHVLQGSRLFKIFVLGGAVGLSNCDIFILELCNKKLLSEITGEI
jgi:hypothetical protein